jgi:type IV pilus assembly protein PilM
MPSSNVCWGIEVGAGAIKALKLEVGSGGEVRILDYAYVPHKKVLSTPELDQNDALRVALGQFASQYELSGSSVAVSVPGHSAFARFAKLPPVEPKKVPDIVKFEAVQQIPFPIDQVEWDFQTFQSPDSPDIEVGIFAITRERIMERLAMYEDLGIVPDYVTLSPVAAYNAMAYDLQFTEKTPGTIILDIGTTSTDLVVAEAGRVWIRTFPIGGHHFTEALVNAFKISYSQAEKHKREAESSKHARHIFQAMRPVFGDLAQDVQRSIGYYTSLHKDAKLERLIGLGSTFRLPGLRKYLKQQLQMDVYRMEQFKRLSLDGPRAGEFQALTLNMATAYGLGLQGLGMATLEANLMPVQVIKGAMWKRKVMWFGAAAGIAVAAGAAMFIRPFIDDSAVASEPPAPIIKETIATAQRLKTEANDLTSTSLSNTAASDVMALLESRAIYAQIVDDVGQMNKAAQDKAPAPAEGKPSVAIVVNSLDTMFTPPDTSAAAGGTPAPADASAQMPRIQVRMSCTTSVPDAQKFVISTVDEWLRKNAKRPNMPYEIVIGPHPSSGFVTTKTAEAAATPGAPGGAGEGMPTMPNRPPPILVGGGGKGVVIGGGATQMGERGGGGGGANEPPPPPDQKAQAAIDQLKKDAPLPGAPQPEPGSSVTKFDVVWDAVLVPKKPEGGAS